MPFQYTFRSIDLESVKSEDRDLLENRDRELELYLNQPYVKVRRAANLNINNSSAYVPFDTEDADQWGFISVTSNTLTTPTGAAGLYAIGAKVVSSSTLNTQTIDLYTNGFPTTQNNMLSGLGYVSAVAYLEAGNEVKLLITNNLNANYTATLWMTRVLA